MSPALLAVPALALALGFGGAATAQAHAPWKHMSEERKEHLQSFKERVEHARERFQENHPNLTPEKRAAINEALENQDYEAFMAEIENAPFADRVTEEKFDAVTEALELRQDGDLEGVREVLKDAGMHKPSRLRAHRLTPPAHIEAE